MQPKIVYSPDYDIQFLGLGKLHPFDSCKYSRAWESLLATFGARLKSLQIKPELAITVSELRTIHTDTYLQKLKNARYVAKVLELPELGFLPQCVLEKHVLQPMQLATAGTVLAAHAAIAYGIAINLSGGVPNGTSPRILNDKRIKITDGQPKESNEGDCELAITNLRQLVVL